MAELSASAMRMPLMSLSAFCGLHAARRARGRRRRHHHAADDGAEDTPLGCAGALTYTSAVA